MLSKEEIYSIKNNLFPFVREIVVKNPNFPWHRDSKNKATASQLVSSQALAVDFFFTIGKLPSRNAIFEKWLGYLDLNFIGPWSIELESLVPKHLLSETRETQIDVLAKGGGGVIAFECKFTEPDGGSCSQPVVIRKGSNKGLRQCNGNYEEQVNPINRIKSRCALSGKGIKYWQCIPDVMNIDPSKNYSPCPFSGGWYQWMRNLAAAHLLGREMNLPPAFVVVYADGKFPMANKARSAAWTDLVAATNGRSVPLRVVSYQQLLELAIDAADETDIKILIDLKVWINKKIGDASTRF